MTTAPYIETREDADRTRAVLEDLLNTVQHEIGQSRHHHSELAHDDASTHTDNALTAVTSIIELEKALSEWQQRSSVDPDEAVAHDAAERRWFEERDLAGAA